MSMMGSSRIDASNRGAVVYCGGCSIRNNAGSKMQYRFIRLHDWLHIVKMSWVKFTHAKRPSARQPSINKDLHNNMTKARDVVVR